MKKLQNIFGRHKVLILLICSLLISLAVIRVQEDGLPFTKKSVPHLTFTELSSANINKILTDAKNTPVYLEFSDDSVNSKAQNLVSETIIDKFKGKLIVVRVNVKTQAEIAQALVQAVLVPFLTAQGIEMPSVLPSPAHVIFVLTDKGPAVLNLSVGIMNDAGIKQFISDGLSRWKSSKAAK